MPRISESLPVFLALASLAPPDRTHAFTSGNRGHNKGRIRTGYYRDSKSHGHNDGRRIALDEEVLEGPFVRRHERPSPQEDDEAPPEFNPYLNNLGISHRLPLHQRPLKGGGSGLNPTDIISGGSNSMSRSPPQSQQFHDRTSEVAGYRSQQQQQQPPPGPPQPPKEFTWSNEANLPNSGPPIQPDNSNINGGAASSPSFYQNETAENDQDVLDAVAQPFDASRPDEPDPFTFYPDVNINGSQQQQQSNASRPQPPATRRPQSDYNSRNPYLGNGSNTRNSQQPPRNPFNAPSRPNFHGITSAPFSFAKDAGASYWNEMSYVERQREKARLAEEEARRQQAEQEARMIEERRRREEAQRQESARLEREAARLEEERRKLEQEQKAEAERLRKEAVEIEVEKQKIAESKRIQREEEERLRRETELEKLRLHKEYQARLAEEEAKRKRIEREEEERARLMAEIETQRIQREQEERIAAEVAKQVAEANRIAEAKLKAEEEARQAEEKKRQQEEQERLVAKLAEEERLDEELRLANEKRKLEEARLAEAEAESKRAQEEQERTATKLAEEQRLLEELRRAEEKRKEEEARVAAETQRNRIADEEQDKKHQSQREELEKEKEKARLLQEATRAEARLADEYQKSAESDSETDSAIDSRAPANLGSSGTAADKSLTPLEKKYAAETVQSNSKTDESNAADTSESDSVNEEFLSSESELLEEARLAEATLVDEKRKIEEAKAEYIRKFEQKLAKEAVEAESKLLEEKRKAQKSSEAKSDTVTPVSSSDSVNRGDGGGDGNVFYKSLTPLEEKFARTTQSANRDSNAESETSKTPLQPAAPQTRSEMEDLYDEESSFRPVPPKRPPPAFEKSRPVSYSVNTKQATNASMFPKRSPKIADTAALVKRIQQGDRQGRAKAGVLLDENGLTPEERIASTITDATKDIIATKRTYETTREYLKSFKSNTQRRLSRAAREKEKAAEKVADIKARMQEKIREVEGQLEATLSKTQDKIDDEVSRIVDLLVAEIELEVKRQEDMVQLMDSLQELVAAKECDIAEDKKIANEMIDVRSKLKDGLIAENLDKEVEQKLSLAAIDHELVNDLFGCLIDLQSLLEDAQDRSACTSQSLEDFVRPETRESNPYDWSDIERMELVFEQAADNVAGAETRIRELSARIDSALVDKVLVLGEDVPPGMAKLARKAAARASIKKAITLADIEMDEMDLEGATELQGMNEKELVSNLGKSVGSTTVEGSKAAAFSLKSMFGSMTGKTIGDTAGQNMDELAEDDEDSGAIVPSGDSTDKGSAPSGTDSSEAANEALKETTKGLLDSLMAAAALSVKMFRGQ